MRFFLSCILLVSFQLLQVAPLLADDKGAVVLVYHRFGESNYPTTNIRMDQFEAHLSELAKGHYNVMSLPDIVKTIRSGEPLLDRSVGISMDDAFLSVYEKAWPLLKKYKLPFTLFISAEPVERNAPGYLNWAQIREMLSDGAMTIGAHSFHHQHLPDLSPAEVKEEIFHELTLLKEHTGIHPSLFAYPYGEASNKLMEEIRDAGFIAAFGQHSGVIHAQERLYFLPRFPLNEHYGDVSRLRQIASALPLPVYDISPDDPHMVISADIPNPPLLGFTVADTISRPENIRCYRSGRKENIRTEHLGKRVELRFDKQFLPGRTRINCTLFSEKGRWHWLGMQYYLTPQNKPPQPNPASSRE